MSGIAGPSPEVDVSVLIPFLDEEAHLARCVPAMQEQDFDGTVEFLFIDGRSTDASRAIVERFAARDPRIRILDNPARRTAAGLNVGLRAARGRYVARMDAHTIYPATYLRSGVERLRAGDVTWVTGPQVPSGAGTWSTRVAHALAVWIGRGESAKWPGAVDTSGAGSAEFDLKTSVFTGVWERSTLDAIGGWDEGWPVNQDSEMAARIMATGGRIVCRLDMGARYVPRDTLAGLGRQYGRYGYYRAKTFLRHPTSLPKSRAFPVAVLLCAIASIAPVRSLRALGRAGFAAYGVGVLGLSATSISRTRGSAAYLPLVFVTMHLSWAVGFVLGLVRWLPKRHALRAWPEPLRRPSEPVQDARR